MIIPKIDLHAHAIPSREYPRLDGDHFLTPDELRIKYDEIGVEKACNCRLLHRNTNAIC
jgi:hypothetical protein